MNKILKKIIEKKKDGLRNNASTHDVSSANNLSLSKSKGRVEGFRNDKFIQAIQKANIGAIIAEIKFASPSAGILGSKKDLIKKVNVYKKAGVDAISVITEKHFFHGEPAFVPLVKKKTSLPVLQKDFVIDKSQIYEAKKLGSDALLLIVRIISLKKLQQFVMLCFQEGIEPVVEINSEADLQKALQTKTRIIAVNARNLDTLAVSVDNACRLIKKIPAKYLRLGFSGVKGKKEFQKYIQAGAQGVLIGTTLMRKEDSDEFISSLKAK